MNYATGLRILFGLGSVAIVVLDQVTKNLVMTRMTLYSSVPVIPGVFHLTLITNTGALFGLFRDFAQPARSLLFTMVPLLAIVLIIVFQYRTSMNDVIAQTGLALILGGAVGNLHYNRSDFASLQSNGLHHFRDTVTFGLRRDKSYNQSDDQSSDCGNNDNRKRPQEFKPLRQGSKKKTTANTDELNKGNR